MGERVASLYREKLVKDGVMPNFEESERLIYKEVRDICRSLAVDRRHIETRLSLRSSAAKGKREMTDLLANMETYFNKVNSYENM